MKYQKTQSVSGNWIKGSEVTSGDMANLVSETVSVESQFKDKNGAPKNQDVAKIQFAGSKESFNIAINRASLNALIDAFGEESSEWTNKPLTVVTEKMRVAGKAVTALYLLPIGYEKVDDEGGYAVIVRIGEGKEVPVVEEEIPFN